MPHFLFVVLLYMMPVILLITFLTLFFDISPRYKKENNDDEDLDKLEEKLTQLIKNNELAEKQDNLYQELQKSDTNIISAYLNINKKSLKGFHLFQLLFSLIKNQADDNKIIKTLRHYLPSCSTSHLYALLRSCREFLKISAPDDHQKTLIRNLNQNKIYKTLIYLQQKLNQTLNLANKKDPLEQQALIEAAAIYSIIFANFSQFYDSVITKKMLNLAQNLSPQIFNLWHQIPYRFSKQNRAYPLYLKQQALRSRIENKKT